MEKDILLFVKAQFTNQPKKINNGNQNQQANQ